MTGKGHKEHSGVMKSRSRLWWYLHSYIHLSKLTEMYLKWVLLQINYTSIKLILKSSFMLTKLKNSEIRFSSTSDIRVHCLLQGGLDFLLVVQNKEFTYFVTS